MLSALEWWGYVHQNGRVHLRRYLDDDDLTSAEKQRHVARVIGPFFAQNQHEARKILANRIHAPRVMDRPMTITKMPDEEKETLAKSLLLDLPPATAAEVVIDVCNSDDEIKNEVLSQLEE